VVALAFAGCFLALATVAGLVAATGSRWLVRLPILALTPVLALAVWWQLSQRDGWPMGGQPADGSAFVAGLVQSPAPGDRGAIYLWMQSPGRSTPRAYRLPYSPQLEKQLARASRDAKAGAHIAVRSVKTKSAKPGHPPSAAPVRFYRLPSPTLPAKPGSH